MNKRAFCVINTFRVIFLHWLIGDNIEAVSVGHPLPAPLARSAAC